MTTLRGFGEQDPDLKSRLRLQSGAPPVREAVVLFPAARDAEPDVQLEVADDDLVEVELDDGTVFWTSGQRLREDTQQDPARSGPTNRLPTRYTSGRKTAQRGVVGLTIKTLKVLGVDLPAGAAKLAAQKIEAQLEGQQPGFYQIDKRGELRPEKIASGSAPVLVFIHGTASSTRGAYGDLFLPENLPTWEKLQSQYGGRVFGFEHRTLTQSPVQNVVDFLQGLPGGPVPPLHLVSHSRGGLVGDLLALGELSNPMPNQLLDRLGIGREEEADPDIRERRKAERLLFERAHGLLIDKHPAVERFVRVACPAGGTTMAAGRLDIYLSLLFGALSKVPGFGPLLGGVGELVAAVAKERSNPTVLPGLEAQMPTSGLIRLLNGSGYELASDLTVIAGDSDGFLKNLANLYFWHANDLVVDTRSMFRGVPRTRQRWYRAAGSEVHHCNYFARPETVNKLVDGLLRPPSEAAGFSFGQPRGAAARSLPPGDPQDLPGRPAVILIPGILGSHLAITGPTRKSDRIWLQMLELLAGNFAKLAIGGTAVQAEALIERFYGKFAKFLQQNEQHVIAFPYDWRRSVKDSAAELAKVLATRLAASDQPIRLVAHSMGGLVVRYLIAEEPALWNDVKRSGGRLLQLGTPNRGSFQIPCLLQGQDKLLGLLAGLDLHQGKKVWTKVLAGFPGVLELAPQDPVDFFQEATWGTLGTAMLSTPSQADLTAARKVLDELAAVELQREPAIYVAGRARETPTLEPGGRSITMTSQGDGKVTWASGIPAGVPCYYVDAEHGDLAKHEKSFAGLLELITTGTTQKLSQTRPAVPPAASRGAAFDEQEPLEVFPSQEALEMAALGMSEEELEDQPAAPKVVKPKVSVVHGDLTYAQYPVMVGHYAGDPILNAEAALDRRLGGKLSARHLLDLYPRSIGSHEIVLGARPAAGQRLEGALVIGLGDAGSLSSGGLTRSVTDALVRYVRILEENEAFGAAELGVTSLLIGSGEMGLSLDQVLQSILLGVRLANLRLRRLAKNGEKAPGIANLELMEINQDRALQALKVLRGLSQLSFNDFEVNLDLRRSDGGRRRVSYAEPGGWWTPLMIKSSDEAPGSFDFTAFGQRARAVPENLEIQVDLVDHLLSGVLSASSAHHRHLCETLFELLLPLRLKRAAADRQNLLLVVDEEAAQYPWEMLIDRLSISDTPVGVDAGLVRQLRFEKEEPKARYDITHPEGLRALVVGDPPSSLVPLPGAQEEARRVAGLLEGRSWTVVRQIRGDAASARRPGQAEIDAESVVCATMTGDYRILHLAGHGIYDRYQPKASGMVLGGRSGSGLLLLSPAEIRQMRLVPELVFVNCCHLGRIEKTPPHQLAANLAIQFIANGVKAVVAAGWAVDDDAALVFADTFYDQMFRGATFGVAVAEARRFTYRSFPTSFTWAAYQCYGDPGFRLTMEVEVRQSSGPSALTEYGDPAEVAAELENLLSRAKLEKGEGNVDKLKKELGALEEVARHRGWLDRGEITGGLGRAYGEITDFPNAIRFYEAARASEGGLASLRDLEQLANLRARFAAERAESGKLDGETALKEIDKSIAELKMLLSLAFTKERSAVLASAYKSRAMLRDDRADLVAMADAYAQAALADPQDLYSGVNALASVLVLKGPWTASRRPAWLCSKNPFLDKKYFEEALEAYRQLAPRFGRHEIENQDRDFWAQTFEIDLELVAALHQSQPDPQRFKNLRAKLQELFARYGSLLQHDSVVKQLGFLAQRIESQDLQDLLAQFKRPDKKSRAVAGEAAAVAAAAEAVEEAAAAVVEAAAQVAQEAAAEPAAAADPAPALDPPARGRRKKNEDR